MQEDGERQLKSTSWQGWRCSSGKARPTKPTTNVKDYTYVCTALMGVQFPVPTIQYAQS